MRISDWSSDVCSSDLNRLFELGMRTPRARELIEVAVPAMEALSDACGQSPHLVVVNNGETVVVASTAGQSEISFTLRLGYRRPVLDATSGRIILAFQDLATRTRLIEEGLALAAGPVDLAALGAQLDAIAARSEEHTSELQSLMRNS